MPISTVGVHVLTFITLDSREPAAIRRLTFGGIAKAVLPLDHPDSNGSYDLLGLCDDGAMLAVERATPSDLLNKIGDKRLFPQLVQLRQVTPFAYLVITGELRPAANDAVTVTTEDGFERPTGWAWTVVQGALLTAQEIGVHVVSCASNLDYERTILGLGNRSRETVRVAPARAAEMVTEAESILMGLPGVGPERAAALLAYCGTPAAALDWLTSNSPQKVPGIGPGTRTRVRRALGLPASEWLAIETVCDPRTGEVLTVEAMETEEVAV